MKFYECIIEGNAIFICVPESEIERQEFLDDHLLTASSVEFIHSLSSKEKDHENDKG